MKGVIKINQQMFEMRQEIQELRERLEEAEDLQPPP